MTEASERNVEKSEMDYEVPTDVSDDFSVFNSQEKNKPKCKACNSTNLFPDYQQGIEYCEDCGTHQSNTILSMSPEWKNGSDTTSSTLNRCNCVIDPLLKKMSLSTRLIGVPRHIGLVHSWHTLYSYKEHSLSKAFKKMDKVAQENAIPEAIVKYAHKLYSLIADKDLKRGDSRIGIMGACIYYGCRARNVMKREKDIAKNMKIDQKYISRGCDTIAEYLFEKGMDAEKVLAPFNIYDYIEEFTDILGLPDKFKIKAMCVASVVDKNSYCLRNMPYSLAAGCIYFVAVWSKRYDITTLKREMKAKCDLSDVTIAKCHNNLIVLKPQLIVALKQLKKK